MKKLLILSLTFGFIGPAMAEPESLTALRSQKDAAVERAVSPINEKYRTELEDLVKSISASGNLEEALKVKKALDAAQDKEIELLKSAPGESDRVRLLREQRNSAIKRALAPINSKYVEELNRIKVALTSEGKLEDAIAVKSEIDHTESHPFERPEKTVELTEAALLGTSWEDPRDGLRYQFEEGKLRVFRKGSDNRYEPGHFRVWTIENAKERQIRIFWNYGEEVGTFNPELNLMTDKVHSLRLIPDPNYDSRPKE